MQRKREDGIRDGGRGRKGKKRRRRKRQEEMMVNKEEIEVVKKKETEDENERFMKCYHNQVQRTVQVSETDEDTNRSNVT